MISKIQRKYLMLTLVTALATSVATRSYPIYALELWSRWGATAKSMMTIPKFKRVWDITKDSRSHEFRELIDSLAQDLQKN
jgi:hypothetical protein